MIYKFNQSGLTKAVADIKGEKIGKRMNIIFYCILVALCIYGVVNFNSIIKLMVCSGTSKIVKYIVG